MTGARFQNEMDNQWDAYVDNLKKNKVFESSLAMYDVNCSMQGDANPIAIALSLLISAVSKAPFNK